MSLCAIIQFNNPIQFLNKRRRRHLDQYNMYIIWLVYETDRGEPFHIFAIFRETKYSNYSTSIIIRR